MKAEDTRRAARLVDEYNVLVKHADAEQLPHVQAVSDGGLRVYLENFGYVYALDPEPLRVELRAVLTARMDAVAGELRALGVELPAADDE